MHMCITVASKCHKDERAPVEDTHVAVGLLLGNIIILYSTQMDKAYIGGSRINLSGPFVTNALDVLEEFIHRVGEPM